jgi:hypothetical protein
MKMKLIWEKYYRMQMVNKIPDYRIMVTDSLKYRQQQSDYLNNLIKIYNLFMLGLFEKHNIKDTFKSRTLFHHCYNLDAHFEQLEKTFDELVVILK